jgi:hypothetical protein
MTTDRTPAPPARRRRRPHPARNARIVSTGAAASLTFGVIAALASNDASAVTQSATRVEGSVTVSDAVDIPATAATVPRTATALPTETLSTRAIVVRRVHHTVPSATAATVPLAAAIEAANAANAASASQAPDAFDPQPAVRTTSAAPTLTLASTPAAKGGKSYAPVARVAKKRVRVVTTPRVAVKPKVRVRRAAPATRAS